MADWRESNRAIWDERVPAHVSSEFYDVDGFRAGRPVIQGFEVDELGALGDLELVHLQCHFGLDTLDLARQHPTLEVTGLDFSAPAIDAARALAAEMGVGNRAHFVHAEVSDAVSVLGAGRFDVVYTGKGSLNWLPDLREWASVVHDLLKPGGRLYLVEFHPVASVLGDESPEPVLDYFSTEPVVAARPLTYAFPDGPDVVPRTEGPPTGQGGQRRHGSGSTRSAQRSADRSANPSADRPVNRSADREDGGAGLSYEWLHPLGSVVSALTREGLVIRFLHEWPFTTWRPYKGLVPYGAGAWTWPGPGTLPLQYSIRADRPAD
ncbi:MAG: class I SAM-dependent methyltransferase [Acidimicrobiaceae bacterium]|nr:class I SAM-dependent methyltransferase [Acidimicrobiaceae bacterium]